MSSLSGVRVLVTRARQQASQLAEALRAEGAEAIEIPAIEIVPPASYDALDSAAARFYAFDWVIFTSANAVTAFERISPLVMHASQPKIAVIGPATGDAVRAAGMQVTLMPQEYVAEALLAELAPMVAGKNVLLIRAEEARNVLPDGLHAAGAHVTIAPAYRNVMPASSVAEIRRVFSTEALRPQAITFTSASTVRNVQELLLAAEVTLPWEIVLASIGPITTAAMRELGLEPQVEASEATIASLVAAMAEHFRR